MAKGFKHGSAAASPINYKVIGGIATPANPAENTIWLNTSVSITDHIFSSNQPNGTDGSVWICIGLTGVVSFNALKKDAVLIFPVSAKQYVSGTWVSVDASIYQSGSWKKLWHGQLFEAGNQFENITGGWIDHAAGAASGVLFTIGNEYIEFNYDSGYDLKRGALYTKNAVNVSDYNTLYADIYAAEVDEDLAQGVSIGLSSRNTTLNPDYSVAFAGTKTVGRQILSLNIADCDGNYYIYFYNNGNRGYIYKIWLE